MNVVRERFRVVTWVEDQRNDGCPESGRWRKNGAPYCLKCLVGSEECAVVYVHFTL